MTNTVLALLLPLQLGLVTDITIAALIAAGIVAVLMDQYIKAVAAGTIFLAVWIVVQLFGINLYIAVILLGTALIARLIIEIGVMGVEYLNQNEIDIELTTLIDDFLTETDDHMPDDD